MKTKMMSVLILSVVCGISSTAFATTDMAVLMQKMQEMENKHAQEMSMVRSTIKGLQDRISKIETDGVAKANYAESAGEAKSAYKAYVSTHLRTGPNYVAVQQEDGNFVTFREETEWGRSTPCWSTRAGNTNNCF